jgi:hypothetical protein
MSDNRKRRVCGRLEDEHVGALDPAFGKIYAHATEQRIGTCPQFQANGTVCPVDEQQCDAECQARPDRSCATETRTESVYERAFKALHEACSRGRLEMTIPVDEQRDHDCLITAGLIAGKAAEKRAEYWERTSIWYQKDASLWEKRAAEEEKRAEAAERERDEARAFLRKTAATGGSIVSSAALDPEQIAVARVSDRLFVTPDGFGFVYLPAPPDPPKEG